MKQCPFCNKEQDEKIEVCDCGYKFEGYELDKDITSSDKKEYKISQKQKIDKQNKKSIDRNFKNKNYHPNDYPVMQLLGKWFNYIALINAIIGCIIALFFLVDGNILGTVGGLLLGLITWAFSKFFSESVIILSDIANNIKVIRNNSEYWKK